MLDTKRARYSCWSSIVFVVVVMVTTLRDSWVLNGQVSRSNGLKHPRGAFAIKGALIARGVGNRN